MTEAMDPTYAMASGEPWTPPQTDAEWDAYFALLRKACDKYWGPDYEAPMMFTKEVWPEIPRLKPIAAKHKIRLIDPPTSPAAPATPQSPHT